MNGHILIVEDDVQIAGNAARYLRRSGYRVEVAGSVSAAAAAYAADQFSLIILDLRLPDGNGLHWLDTLRLNSDKIPVIITSSLIQDVDQLNGYRSGANDYVVKPYKLPLLAERVRVWLDASGPSTASAIRFDPVALCIASAEHHAWLTPTEAFLLGHLSSAPGAKLTRADLLSTWPGRTPPKKRTIDHYVCRLRAKLDLIGATDCVATVQGGYVWRGTLQEFTTALSRNIHPSGRSPARE